MQKKVVLYSTKDCPYCLDLKKSLNNARISYDVVAVIIADENNGTGSVFTPDVHFDEVHECFDLIVKALR